MSVMNTLWRIKMFDEGQIFTFRKSMRTRRLQEKSRGAVGMLHCKLADLISPKIICGYYTASQRAKQNSSR